LRVALTAVALAVLSQAAGASNTARPWADPARCPLTTSLKALGSVASAPRDWKVLHGHFQLYGACDDGAVAEGYSEDVVALLAKAWPLLPDLASLARSDPTFLDFVLAHIDSSPAAEDLAKVRVNADRHCPRGHKGLCKRISERAASALGGEEGAARR
jgi:hypothetical protein